MKEAFQYIDLNSSWMSFVLNISFHMHEELEQAELKQVYAWIRCEVGKEQNILQFFLNVSFA